MKQLLHRDDPQWRLHFLSDFVEKNAPPDSGVAKAFAEFMRQFDYRRGAGIGAQQLAWEAWRSLTQSERNQILGGWLADDRRPTAEEFFKTRCGLALERIMQVSSCDHGLLFCSDFRLGDGSGDNVVVQVLEGTDLATVIYFLRSLLSEIEEKWATAIKLDRDEYFHVGEGKPLSPMPSIESTLAAIQQNFEAIKATIVAQQIAPAKFPVGTLIADKAGSGGIVIAVHEAAEGEALYVYREADGRIGSQYESEISGHVEASRPSTGPKKKPQTTSKHAPKLGGKGHQKKVAAAA